MGNIDGFGQYKIGGSGGSSTGNTIYTANDTVTSDRTVNANSNKVDFSAVDSMTITDDGSTTSATVLKVDSTTKGFLKPVITGAQAEAISSPPEGLEIYATNAGGGDITQSGWWGYNGTNWVQINGGSSVSGADPSQAITGTKVDGVAATFMRSDAAPALSLTGVTADTYGSTTQVAQITVDDKGRITNALNQTIDTPTADNPSATVSGTVTNGSATTFMRSDAAPALSTTGVTAATYGNSSNVAQFTVDVNGRITAASNVPVSGGGTAAYTTLTGADVINWDYATHGPNIKVVLGASFENVLTINTLTEFPDGSSGFIIIDPTNSTSYKLPDEDYGSATGLESKLSGGNSTLGGSNEALFHWTYDGSTFYFQKDINYVDPVYPPSIQFNTTNLIAYYTPQAFNQATQGTVSAGALVENLTSSNLIGDLVTSSNVTNFEFYPKTATDPAYWSMGGTSNAILRQSNIASGITTEATFSGYMQGPYVSQTFGGVFDFVGTQSLAAFDQQVYLTSLVFRLFSPDFFFSYPALQNYTGTGGADLQNEWLFMSFAFTPSTTSGSNDGFVRMAIGCQSSLDAAVAAGGATNWDYDGNGNTVPVDANGLYFETSSNIDLDEFFFENFYLGNAVGLAEPNQAHYGEFGIFNAVIPDSQVVTNWTNSRATYGIT